MTPDTQPTREQVDRSFALLNIQLSVLSQSPEVLALLDTEQREVLRFQCEQLLKALDEGSEK